MSERDSHDGGAGRGGAGRGGAGRGGAGRQPQGEVREVLRDERGEIEAVPDEAPPDARASEAPPPRGDAPTATDPGRVTVQRVREHPATRAFLRAAGEHLRAVGFTEHGERHAELVATIATNVLVHLGYDARQAELAAVAGLLHDIGNTVNRDMHGQIGALMAKDILCELGMPLAEVGEVMGAIGNHESAWGRATSPVAAALILADKADVHRSRVQKSERAEFDIHDRVNFAVTHSFLRVAPDRRVLTLELTIDPEIASVLNYFEIFTARMVFCRTASEVLNCTFALEVNGNRLS